MCHSTYHSASGFLAAWPSEKTIANLSTEQKREVCRTYLEESDGNNIYRLGNHFITRNLGPMSVDKCERSFFPADQKTLTV